MLILYHFQKKVGLASLKSDIDKLDIDKLKKVPTSVNNLKSEVYKIDITKVQTTPSDVLETDIVKKTLFYRLNSKVVGLENSIQ